jgi:hypothetical protein
MYYAQDKKITSHTLRIRGTLVFLCSYPYFGPFRGGQTFDMIMNMNTNTIMRMDNGHWMWTWTWTRPPRTRGHNPLVHDPDVHDPHKHEHEQRTRTRTWPWTWKGTWKCTCTSSCTAIMFLDRPRLSVSSAGLLKLREQYMKVRAVKFLNRPCAIIFSPPA